MKRLSLLNENQRNVLLDGVNVLCQIFWGPSLPQCKALRKQEILREMELLNLLMAINASINTDKLNAIIRRFESSEDLFDYLETTYVRLFISNRKGMLIPLYQSCYEYENAPMMGAPAVAMKERLATASLSLETHINEPPDHLCVELEYLYFLLTKGWSGENGSFFIEAASFASDVMLPWVSKLQKRIMTHQDSTFYSMFASWMLAVLKFIGDSG